VYRLVIHYLLTITIQQRRVELNQTAARDCGPTTPIYYQ